MHQVPPSLNQLPPRKYRWVWLTSVLFPGAALLWLVGGPSRPGNGSFSPATEQSSQFMFDVPGPELSTVGPARRIGAPRRAAPAAVAQIGAGPYSYKAVDGELLVKLHDRTPRAAVDALARSLGSEILGQGARSGVYRFRVPRGVDLEGFSSRLYQSREVEEARPNAIAEAADCEEGEYRLQQWNLDLIEESLACDNFNAELGAIVVAVLDTGVAHADHDDGSNHYRVAPDLASTVFVPGYDFVNDDSHPDDDHQHGTHVASIIGARGGVAGVAPGVQLMPVKVLGADKQGSELGVVEGIYYAVDHGADVINMSLAFGPGYFPSSSLQAAITYAVEHGVALVASAGNDGGWGVRYPAAFPDVIAAGAARLAREDGELTVRRAQYSEKGHALDVMAPGGMLSRDMNRDGYPDGILAQSIELNNPGAFGYYYYAGTSQAAAHVSGTAAWLLADGVRAADVTALLSDSALDMKQEGLEPATGAGLVQLEAARQLALDESREDAAQYYVNLLPWLEVGPEGGVRAVARVEVIDAYGVPAPDMRIGGSWFGSVTAFNATATTDANGVAELRSNEMFGLQGIAVGFQVERILAPGRLRTDTPVQFYSLSPAAAEVYARMLADSVVSHSLVLYKLEPSDAALDALVDRSTLLTSFVMKPVGAGMRSGPLAIALDSGFAPELAQPSPETVTALSWAFPAPLYSGWGMVDRVDASLVSVSSPRLGPAERYVILRLDPLMASLDPAHGYPVLNDYASVFLESNRVFGNGFASSTLGDGFASSTLGDGFASSTLGDGFASSTLGDGFASSTLGDGFASSTLGDGFASSTLGDGFASSTLGDSVAGAILGAAFATSGSAAEEATARAEAASSPSDGSVIALETFDPAVANLITEEAESTPAP